MGKKNIGFIGCPLCGEQREVREDKKGKPFIQCIPCGLQMFVRGIQGIALLQGQIELTESGGILAAGKLTSVPSGEIFRLLQRADQLSAYRKQIEKSSLSGDDKSRARKIIDRELAEIRRVLDNY